MKRLQVAADLQTQLSSAQQLLEAEQQEAASCRMQLRQQKQRHEQQQQQQRHAHEQQLQDLQQDLEQQLEQKEEAMRKVQVGCKAPRAVLTYPVETRHTKQRSNWKQRQISGWCAHSTMSILGYYYAWP